MLFSEHQVLIVWGAVALAFVLFTTAFLVTFTSMVQARTVQKLQEPKM